MLFSENTLVPELSATFCHTLSRPQDWVKNGSFQTRCMDSIEVNLSVALAFPLKWRSCCEVNFYHCLRLFFSLLMDTTALLCWSDAPLQSLAPGPVSQVMCLSQLTGLQGKPSNPCHCSAFLDVFALLRLALFLFSFGRIKPYFLFQKLNFHARFYCRLKAGTLEGHS